MPVSHQGPMPGTLPPVCSPGWSWGTQVPGTLEMMGQINHVQLPPTNLCLAFLFLTVPCSMWDPSSPSRDQIHIGSTEFNPLDHKGGPSVYRPHLTSEEASHAHGIHFPSSRGHAVASRAQQGGVFGGQGLWFGRGGCDPWGQRERGREGGAVLGGKATRL